MGADDTELDSVYSVEDLVGNSILRKFRFRQHFNTANLYRNLDCQNFDGNCVPKLSGTITPREKKHRNTALRLVDISLP